MNCFNCFCIGFHQIWVDADGLPIIVKEPVKFGRQRCPGGSQGQRLLECPAIYNLRCRFIPARYIVCPVLSRLVLSRLVLSRRLVSSHLGWTYVVSILSSSARSRSSVLAQVDSWIFVETRLNLQLFVSYADSLCMC